MERLDLNVENGVIFLPERCPIIGHKFYWQVWKHPYAKSYSAYYTLSNNMIKSICHEDIIETGSVDLSPQILQLPSSFLNGRHSFDVCILLMKDISFDIWNPKDLAEVLLASQKDIEAEMDLLF